jgi:DNA-binding beta-propeller fold protein YncE
VKNSFWRVSIVVLVTLLVLTPAVLARWTYQGEIRIDGTKSYRGMALSNDEKTLYVVGLQNKVVLAYDVTSSKPDVVAFTALPNPNATSKAVYISSDDHVWVPATTIFEVYEFTADLNLVAIHDISNLGVITCEGILVDKAGSLYLSERTGSAGMVKLIPSATGWQRDNTWGIQGAAELGGDVRIATMADDGTIFAGIYAGSNANLIYKIDAEGKKYVFADNLAHPIQLDLDAQGRLYSVNYASNPILTIISPSGSMLETYEQAELGLNTPGSGLAVTKDGKKLYILDEQDIAVRIYQWVD